MIMHVILDLGKYNSIAEIHGFLSKNLNFEEYYGYNLDALYDSLSTRHVKTNLEIINFDNIGGVYKKDVERLINVFEDVAEVSDYFSFSIE